MTKPCAAEPGEDDTLPEAIGHRLVALQTALDTMDRAKAEELAARVPASLDAGWMALLLGRDSLRRSDVGKARGLFEQAGERLGAGAAPWILQVQLEDGMPGTDLPASEADPVVRLGLLAAALRQGWRDEAAAIVRSLPSSDLDAAVVLEARRAVAVALSSGVDGDGPESRDTEPAPASGRVIGGVATAPDARTALAWRLCAELWRTAGQPASQVRCLMRAAILMPWRLDWQYAAATALIRSSDHRLLSRFWRDLPVCFPQAPRWLLLRCFSLWRLEAPLGEVLKDCRKARALAPDWWPVHLAEACVLADWAGVEAAEGAFERFWTHGGPCGADDEGSRPLAAMALRAAERAVVLTRRSGAALEAAVWNDMGAVCFRALRLEEAAQAFHRTLAIDPMQRHASINLAVLLLLQGKRGELRTYLQRHRFAATLPRALLLENQPEDCWPSPVDVAEWRRDTVFSQCWWRALADG